MIKSLLKLFRYFNKSKTFTKTKKYKVCKICNSTIIGESICHNCQEWFPSTYYK